MMIARCAIGMCRDFLGGRGFLCIRDNIARLVFVLMVAEVAAGFSSFMLAIGAHHSPAQLEGECNRQHIDEPFNHGENYTSKTSG